MRYWRRMRRKMHLRHLVHLILDRAWKLKKESNTLTRLEPVEILQSQYYSILPLWPVSSVDN